jgi:hypothetical protein
MRHWLVVGVIQIFYILVVICYTISGYPPYAKAAKWSTLAITGFYILLCFITLVVFFALEFLTRKKLEGTGGNEVMLRILNKKEYD